MNTCDWISEVFSAQYDLLEEHAGDDGAADRVEAELAETRERLACSRSEQEDRRLRARLKFLCRRLAELRPSAEGKECAP